MWNYYIVSGVSSVGKWLLSIERSTFRIHVGRAPITIILNKIQLIIKTCIQKHHVTTSWFGQNGLNLKALNHHHPIAGHC